MEPIQPLMRGTFRLYEAPDGGFHLEYRPDMTDEDQQIDIPGGIVRMARMASEGKTNPFAMIKGMFT